MTNLHTLRIFLINKTDVTETDVRPIPRPEDTTMTKLVYRGVAYDANEKKEEPRIVRRPELVYRGVVHNGIRTLEQTNRTTETPHLFYRGFRTA